VSSLGVRYVSDMGWLFGGHYWEGSHDDMPWYDMRASRCLGATYRLPPRCCGGGVTPARGYLSCNSGEVLNCKVTEYFLGTCQICVKELGLHSKNTALHTPSVRDVKREDNQSNRRAQQIHTKDSPRMPERNELQSWRHRQLEVHTYIRQRCKPY
jgi:hypothetical protein